MFCLADALSSRVQPGLVCVDTALNPGKVQLPSTVDPSKQLGHMKPCPRR